MECGKCGQRLGSLQVHDERICERQQEVNRANRGEPCPWCGGYPGDNRFNLGRPVFEHKSGCPRGTR